MRIDVACHAGHDVSVSHHMALRGNSTSSHRPHLDTRDVWFEAGEHDEHDVH